VASAAMPMGDPPGREDGDLPATGIVGAPQGSPSPMPDAQKQAQGAVNQVKQLHTQIDDLARQYPAGAKALSKAKDAVTEAMTQIISEMQKSQKGGANPMAA
jgi:hypothetical protein